MCDWVALRTHYEQHGRAEGRRWGCDLSSSSSQYRSAMPKMSAECKAYQTRLTAASTPDAAEPHPLRHELFEAPPLASLDHCVAMRLEKQALFSGSGRRLAARRPACLQQCC